ncbi:phosphoesterase PA-phosphatase [Desulfuromonas soudanensis]|uniref:Phosphoesterase PA-phosphatase n=1 Tax=Desulfuromonas soudanensis TaxID=1603606 RepID=A0A0M4D1J6_9BACT|nr:VanZ family protein [Desulfuromonas soudanensis]ALC16684.1 phosphoesterase PA-phosphatase [Desulfuromonas soudanensis]
MAGRKKETTIQVTGGNGKALSVYILATVLWMVAIAWLSLVPAPPDLGGVFGWDKLQHAVAYAVLTFLTGRVFSAISPRPLRAWGGALLFAITLGFGLEVAQELFTIGRRGDPADILANSLGALAGCVSGHFTLRRRRGDAGDRLDSEV